MTEIPVLSIDPAHPDRGVIRRAEEALANGELVVAPTETRYGLLARADSDKATERVLEAKGRGVLRPVALFVRDEGGINALGDMTPSAERLMRAFLPGPLTLVLRSRVTWGPPRVVDGLIGLRWSSSPVITELMHQVSFPVTATSANLSGSEELETIAQIRDALGDAISLYLDGGRLSGPVSTVVRCVGDDASILREGAISSLSIQSLLREGGRP
jgi:L-threonylcarbamoyladenylate synthase